MEYRAPVKRSIRPRISRSGDFDDVPSRRGGNNNPGINEAFYGEVDDIIAAYDYAAALDYVDPTRIYLGGHSTGGTLALLVAESTEKFRAIFALGPAGVVAGYGQEELPFDIKNENEVLLRAPVAFVQTIRTPTFIIEGQNGNAAQLPLFDEHKGTAPVTVVEIAGHDHFDAIAPVTELLAKKVLADTGASIPLTKQDFVLS